MLSANFFSNPMAEAVPNNDGSTAVTTMNDLPEKVLPHILSFLPTLDAIQTTVLSRKWRDLWTSLPSLSFDYTLFPPYDSPSQTLQAFAHFINRALILRSHSHDLRSLGLQFDHTDETLRYQPHIDSYLRYAVDHNAHYLQLSFHPKLLRRFEEAENGIVYHFPLSVLRNSSVRGLVLKHCNLTLPIDSSRMRFEALQSVFLEQVYLTDEMVSDLVSGCLNLESLVIMKCDGMKDVKISSSRLTKLGLWDLKCGEGSVEICAPKLHELDFLFNEVGRYVMEDSSALVEADVCFHHQAKNYGYWSKVLSLLGHVKRLSIQNWGFKLVAAKDFFSASSFCNLKYLALQTSYSKSDLLGIAALLNLSPNLETMILEPLLKIDEEIFEESVLEEFKIVHFCIPSLKNLKIKCYRGAEDDLYFVKLVLKNEVVLERIVLVPALMGRPSVTPTILVKQPPGFQVLQGSFLVSKMNEELNFYFRVL